MPSNTHQIRVLVVDDHNGMREGISAVVNAQPDMKIVGEARDGQKALRHFKALQPDVTLLDWNLPVLRGEEVLSTLRTEFPNARFIIITCLNEDECIRRAISLGAMAYLHKDMLRRELLPAIRAVYQEKQYLPAEIESRLKNN